MVERKQTIGRALGAFLLLMGAVAAPGAWAAAPIVVGGELQGATGVNVDGVVYDIQLVEGSCIDVYDGCDDVSDFPFTTVADATAAAQAILDQVLRDTAAGDFDTIPDSVAGCDEPSICGLQIPYALPDATNVTAMSAVNAILEENDSASSFDWERTLDTGTGALAQFATWVVWTPVPPATPDVVAGELVGAFDVDLDGTLYDVVFMEGTCGDLFLGCDAVTDFRFQTAEEATAAANALLDQVILDSPAGDFDSFPDQVFGCGHPAVCGAQIPFELPDATNVTIASAINSSNEVADQASVLAWDKALDTGVDTLSEFAMWAIWTPVPTATPNVVVGELKGATNVDVGGTLYDVQFVEGTCAAVFDGCDDPSDFDFPTEADARVAAQALLDHVLRDTGAGDFDSFPDQVFGCLNPAICGAQTPFDLPDATNVTIASAVNSSAELADQVSILNWDKALDTGTDSLNEFAMWAVWTPAGTDSDGDGVPDGTDNCPDVANGGQEDTDGDGVGDACDVCAGFDDNVDADGDGTPDGCDICPAGDDSVDTDLDGVPDACDVCSGFDDAVDTDGDGTPDGCDVCPAGDDSVDGDGDGVPDACDVCSGFDDAVDSDGDGTPDGCDICPAGDDSVDGDGDGVPDACDVCSGFDDSVDSDGDGTPDGCDICPAGDDSLDGDGDGVPDACDVCSGFDDAVDSDGDGTPDGCDVCPAGDDSLDGDGDGVPDACDVCSGFDDGVDSDGDGTPDGCDLCPAGDDALDADGDGVPDACDACAGFDDGVDSDGDGAPDGCDVCPGADDALDGDADGVADGCDNCPADPNPDQADNDQDGIGDVCDETPIAVPGLQDWGLMILVLLLITSSLVMTSLGRQGGLLR